MGTFTFTIESNIIMLDNTCFKFKIKKQMHKLYTIILYICSFFVERIEDDNELLKIIYNDL